MDVVELIKKDLQDTTDMYGRPEIDKFVILKKDDKGYYIEYAFKEGAPHDNRCLSWYDSYQEEAYRRHGWLKGLSKDRAKKKLDRIRQEREAKIGKVFRLYSFTCSYEDYEETRLKQEEGFWNATHRDENGNPLPFIPEDHICKVGCPAKVCENAGRPSDFPWTYENPVKCACWALADGKTMEDFIEDYKIYIPATELAKLMP